MSPEWRRRSALAVVMLVAASCGGAKHQTTPVATTTTTAATTTIPPAATTTTPPTATTAPTTSVEPLAATVTVTPDQGVAGTTAFTFRVTIKGPGTLDAEAVAFGDGATSGANAGKVHCGDTARADHSGVYRHTYEAAGTYQFRDDVYVIGPPPSCKYGHVRAAMTRIVAAPLSAATFNGAFLSPTKNIACGIDASDTATVRCATFSPPQLVTMGATGIFQTCFGNKCDLGNPAGETPVLAYGSATGGGPFQCISTRSGVTCTVVGHKGFTISAGGIRPVT